MRGGWCEGGGVGGVRRGGCVLRKELLDEMRQSLEVVGFEG